MGLFERLRSRLESPPPIPSKERLRFELDPETSARVRRAARLRGQPPRELMEDLLDRGLKRAALQAQALAILEALTPRQRQVAWLTVQGYTNRQMAEALVISPETVKTHIHHVLQRFEVHSKADLRVLLLDLGVRWWEQPDHPGPIPTAGARAKYTEAL